MGVPYKVAVAPEKLEDNQYWYNLSGPNFSGADALLLGCTWVDFGTSIMNFETQLLEQRHLTADTSHVNGQMFDRT